MCSRHADLADEPRGSGEGIVETLNRRPTVLIRCDASPQIGLGHFIRCLSLAGVLEQRYGANPVFAMRLDAMADHVMAKRYLTVAVPKAEPYGAWLTDTSQQYEARLLVADVRDGLAPHELRAVRSSGVPVALIDDLSDRRLAADLLFYPQLPQIGRADWTGFTGKIFSGWPWIILRPEFSRRVEVGPTPEPTLLVTMGGSDPAGLTLKVVRALELLDLEFTTVVVLGPGFGHRDTLNNLLSRAQRRFVLRQDVSDMSSLMARTDLALCSFGVTAYELAAAGVPAIYLCLTEDHAESASALADAEMGVTMGVFKAVTDSDLADTVRELLVSRRRRERMSDQGCRYVDGLGAVRVANILAKHLSWSTREYSG